MTAARAEAAWVAACVAVFLALAGSRARGHPYPYYDDVAYLDLGNQIRELGGPLALGRELFAGRFAEDNRHPLYPALLSLVAGRDAGYHSRAQALAHVLGAAALVSVFWAARRALGARAALASLALLSLSATLVEHSAKESCEALLLALWAGALGALVAERWALAGALAGAAYLTKGTGLFLPICLVIAAAAVARGRVTRALLARLAAFGAAFALVASPLLVRNARRFGWPLHTLNSRYLWIDPLPDFSEVFAPGADARLAGGFFDYLHRTSFGALAWRLLSGAGETLFHMGDALSLDPPRPYGPVHLALIALGLVLAAVALRLVWRSERGLLRTLVLVQAAWFFAFFTVFAAASGSSRYLLPVAATLWCALGAGLAARAGPRWWRAPGWPRRAAVTGGLAALAALSLDTSPRLPPPGFLETQDWLVSHVQPGEAYALDARTQLQPLWLAPRGVRQVLVSAAFRGRPVPEAELVATLRSERVRWVVLDASAQLDPPAAEPRARYLFYDRLPLGPDGGLPPDGFPAGLRLAHADERRRWVVLELPPTAVR